MYRLYQALYTRRDGPPTAEEVQLAQGTVPVDAEAAKAFLGNVETATANIIQALQGQAQKARVINSLLRY